MEVQLTDIPVHQNLMEKTLGFLGYAEIPSRFLRWCGNCEGDSHSPPEGEAA
jgi:hypothetical protein